MKFFFCTFLAVTSLFAAAPTKAQLRGSSEAATIEQRLGEDLGIERLPTATPEASRSRNVTALLQMGAGNSARLDQRELSAQGNQAYVVQVGVANILGVNQIGGENKAYVTQRGVDNRTSFTQDGQSNTSTITQQGTSNRLTGVVDGDRNEVNVHQDGANNQINGEIRQDGRTYNIKQYGIGNTLNQLESTNQVNRGYNVEMRGNGINLTIQQGKVLP